MRWLVIGLLAACADGAPEPSVAFLTPNDGDEVPVGGVGATVVVEHFELVLVQDSLQHNEGEPEGHLLVTVDGDEVLRTGATNFTVALDEAGPATLGVELVFADGDPLEPPVSASVDVTAVAE